MKSLLHAGCCTALLLCGIASSDARSWQARHDMSPPCYQSEFDTFLNQGYRLVHIDGYTVDGRPHFAAIWEERNGPEQIVRHNLTASEYQNEFKAHTRRCSFACETRTTISPDSVNFNALLSRFITTCRSFVSSVCASPTPPEISYLNATPSCASGATVSQQDATSPRTSNTFASTSIRPASILDRPS